MLTHQWNSANATSLPKISSTLDTSSAPQASDHYHQRHKPSRTCTHLKQLSWYVHFIQAPILCYPDPARRYKVYTDASHDACGAQLSQEHNGAKFPIAFLFHTFTETQRKWNTPEQEAYRVYYANSKWNYYLQGSDIIVCNSHKPLAKFLNVKNANNKVNK